MNFLYAILLFCGVAVSSNAQSLQTWNITSDSIRITLTTNTTTQALCITSLSINTPTPSNTPSYEWTANLFQPECKPAFPTANTGLGINGTYLFSQYDPQHSSVSVTSPSHIDVTNVLIRFSNQTVLATETWSIDLSSSRTLTWSVKRTYRQSVTLSSSRLGTFATSRPANGQTSGFPYDTPQIWGFLDVSMTMNATANGGYIVGQVDNDGPWYQVLSLKQQQGMHIAPINDVVSFAFQGVSSGQQHFAYGKPPSDGTVDNVFFGVEGVDPNGPHGPTATYKSGDVESATITFMVPTTYQQFKHNNFSFPVFNLSLPKLPQLEAMTKDFSETHNQWMGWIFGNNPYSTPCLHEMGWWGMFQVHYTSKVQLHLYHRQLEFFGLGGGVDAATNYIWPRWSIGPPYSDNNGGFYAPPWGKLQDQVPHMIINLYYAVLGLGREALLDFIALADTVGEIMLSRIDPKTNVYKCPGSGLNDTKMHSSNWWDIIEFGNYDAYVNIHVVRAAECLAKLYNFANNATQAKKWNALHHTLKAAHNTMFWNEAKGMYADWIDVNGVPRYYFYTDVNTLAIVWGAATQAMAKKILQVLVDREAVLAKQYNVSIDQIWGTPANLWPTVGGDCVDTSGSGNVCPNTQGWPNYENGLIFPHSTGLEIAAWGVAGDANMALKKYKLIMNAGYAANKLYCQGFNWATGAYSTDPDPTNSNLIVLWGFLRGALGLELELDGVMTGKQKAAAELEGARHCFLYLGMVRCVCVVNQQAQLCA